MKKEENIQILHPIKGALACTICVNREAELINSRLCVQCINGKKNNFKLVSERVLKGMGLEKREGKVVKTIH